MKLKKLACLAAVCAVGTMGVGCSNNNGSEAAPSTAPSTSTGTEASSEPVSTEPVTLKVWESVDGPDEFIKQAGAAFTEKYPNITVEFVNVELADSTTQIALDGPAGVGPDVFAAPHDKLGELVAGGHILPTENAADMESKVLGACSTALTYDGTMYG